MNRISKKIKKLKRRKLRQLKKIIKSTRNKSVDLLIKHNNQVNSFSKTAWQNQSTYNTNQQNKPKSVFNFNRSAWQPPKESEIINE